MEKQSEKTKSVRDRMIEHARTKVVIIDQHSVTNHQAMQLFQESLMFLADELERMQSPRGKLIQ